MMASSEHPEAPPVAPHRKRTPTKTLTARYLSVVLSETRRLGRGITAAEFAAAFLAQHEDAPSRKDLVSGLSRLVRRGLVTKVGGSIGRTQYAHAEHPFPFGAQDEPMSMVIEAVRHETQRLRRPVSSSEVHAHLVQAGLTTLSLDYLRVRLQTLARDSTQKRKRAHKGWKHPQLRRLDRKTAGGGGTRVFWTLAKARNLDPPPTDIASELLRRAFEITSAALGRPVSRREVRWWAAAQLAGLITRDAEHTRIANEVMSGKLAKRLQGVRTSDSVHPHEDGRLTATKTPFNSRSHPCRYSVRPASVIEAAACLVEDLALILRPLDEVEGIATLRALASEIGSPLLEEISVTRESLLGRIMAGFVPPAMDAKQWYSEAVDRALQALPSLKDWFATCSGSYRTNRPDEIGKQLRALRVVAATGFIQSATDVRVCSLSAFCDVPGSKVEIFEPLVREMFAMAERAPANWTPAVAGARRVRGPISGNITNANPDDACSFVDRPDALITIVRAAGLAQLGALTEAASSLLGFVLRDAGALHRWLEEVHPGEKIIRQPLLVGLGLLGCIPELRLACPDPEDVEDVTAYLAAVILGVDDPQERLDLCEAADQWARGVAREVTDRVLSRVECGIRLAALE